MQSDCLYVKYHKFGLCELFDFNYGRENCTIISAEIDTDMAKCLDVPPLSCSKMMGEECKLNNTVPTYISQWPHVKKYEDCQQHCADQFEPACNFWNYDAVEETCRLYHHEMRTCDALVIPQTEQSAYCTDDDERDGGWSNWSPFSSCSSTDGNCRRIRTRDCDSPPKSARGLPCPGSYEEFEDCAQDACPVSFAVTVEKDAGSFAIPAGTIYFDYLLLDHGDNFHMPSGTFRTPMDGVYLFMLDGSNNNKAVDLTIQVNGVDRRKILDSDTPRAEVNGVAVLKLEAYDLVNVKVATAGTLNAGKLYPFTFMGFLLT